MRVRNYYFTGELQLDAIPRLLVFNKIDLVDPEELQNRRLLYNAIPISAIDRSTLRTLVTEISQRLPAYAVIAAS